MKKPKKNGRPTNRSRAGRKTIMTKETIQKLEDSFSVGSTDLEACMYADISMATLYNYQKDNPEFIERKEMLKEKLVLKCRKELIKAVEGNGDLALKVLERKKKDEFSLRTEFTGKNGGPIEMTGYEQKLEEARQKINARKKQKN
jgi:hypothetical protein